MNKYHLSLRMASLTSCDYSITSGCDDVIYGTENFDFQERNYATNHFCNKVIQTLQSILITVAGL